MSKYCIRCGKAVDGENELCDDCRVKEGIRNNIDTTANSAGEATMKVSTPPPPKAQSGKNYPVPPVSPVPSKRSKKPLIVIICICIIAAVCVGAGLTFWLLQDGDSSGKPSGVTADTTDTEAVIAPDPTVVYAEKIGEYKQALSMGADNFNNEYSRGDTFTDINGLMVKAAYDSGYIGYTFYDIDNNGMPELIFSNLDSVIDIYTTDGETVHRLFGNVMIGVRNSLDILTDGRLLTRVSTGADSGGATVYTIDSDTGELIDLDSYHYDERAEESGAAGLTYMTLDEYSDTINSLLADSIFDTFSWTVITPKDDIAVDTDDVPDVTAEYVPDVPDIFPEDTMAEDTAGLEPIVTVAPPETEESHPVTHTHKYENWKAVDSKKHEGTCTVCGEKQTANHVFDSGKVTKQPTETAEGIKTYTCTVCGAAKAEAIPKLAHTHSYGSWSIDKSGTTHTRTCSCGKMQTEPHNYDSGKVTKQPTETAEGIKTYTCTVCGAAKAEAIPKIAHTHSYGDWTSIDDEYHAQYCDCGAEVREVHNFDEGTITIEPTYYRDGIVTYTCIDCGWTRTDTVPKIEHTHSYGDWSSFSTHDHSRSCSCGKTEYENHTFDNGKVTKEPTETSEGVKLYTCTTCGATAEYTLPTLDSYPLSDYIDSEHQQVCYDCGQDDGTATYRLYLGIVTDTSWTCSACGHYNKSSSIYTGRGSPT